jgi:hypothetical protein
MDLPKILLVDCGISRSDTPRRLVERLRQDIGDSGEVHHNRVTDSSTIFDALIRWGTVRWPELDVHIPHVLNRNSAIQFNLNKKNAHKKMMEAQVNVPPMYETYLGAMRTGQSFLRRRRRHSCGRDILLVQPNRYERLTRQQRSGYYVKLIDKEKEYRLHMVKGNCVGLAEKCNPQRIDNGTRITGRSDYIWNNTNGWDFEYIPREERERRVSGYNQMLEQSKKALEALELDMGSVDLIVEKDTHTPFVLEVNTAPSLHQTKRFSKAIIKWLEDEEII